MRLVLKPGLRPIWRDAKTLQLGTDPATAMVLTDLSPRLARTISQLNGSIDERILIAGEPEIGILLDRMRAAGVLVDVHSAAWPGSEQQRARLAPDLAALGLIEPNPLAVAARRAGAYVQVVGGGRVGASTAQLLAAAGVGTVALHDVGTTSSADVLPGAWQPPDVGIPRFRMVAGQKSSEAPDLVLLCPRPVGLPDLDFADALMAAATPHLFATVHETRGVVGPFVLPPEGPCLRCLDLHRCDADPGWARIPRGPLDAPGAVEACDGPLATSVAALATRQALSWIGRSRDRPAEVLTGSFGATLETLQGDWRLRRRSWTAHPACTHGTFC